MVEPFWDAFVCHSGADKDEVVPLVKQLEERGLRCWLDKYSLRPGTEWKKFVASEANRMRAIVVVVGPHGESEGQQFEVENLVPLMRERGLPVVPIVLASCGDGNPRLPAPLTGESVYLDFRPQRGDSVEALAAWIRGRNPYEREAVAAYWDGLANVAGAELEAWLHARIRRGHKNRDYRATTDIVANLFTDPDDPTRLVTYDGRLVDKEPADRPRFQVWNKDHIWPKAFGFADHRAIIGDLHNIVASVPEKNAKRGAGLFFDPHLDRDAPQREALQPADAARGVVARACFYMALRYRGDAGEPHLSIVEAADLPDERGPQIGSLLTLLYWHKIAPVSVAERRRNDAILAAQGNRNPFVDHPDLADRVFYPV